MRPLEVQRREEAKARRGGGVLFPGGDGREEAMARRSKTIPKEEKKKAPEYYIGDRGEKLTWKSGGEEACPTQRPATTRSAQVRSARPWGHLTPRTHRLAGSRRQSRTVASTAAQAGGGRSCVDMRTFSPHR